MSGSQVYISFPTSASPDYISLKSTQAVPDGTSAWRDYIKAGWNIGPSSWTYLYVDIDGTLQRRFNALASRWKRETATLSSIQEITLHPAYQQIIGMGPAAIQFILKELQHQPDFWFWALTCLTGEDPVSYDMRGDVAAMTKAWLNWGAENGYL